MAAFLRVEEGGVLHPTVFELLLPEVCRGQRDVDRTVRLYIDHFYRCLDFEEPVKKFIRKILSFLVTCVVEDGVFDGAILKEGVCGLDILKVAVFKQRVLKLHRLYLNVCKPKIRQES